MLQSVLACWLSAPLVGELRAAIGAGQSRQQLDLLPWASLTVVSSHRSLGNSTRHDTPNQPRSLLFAPTSHSIALPPPPPFPPPRAGRECWQTRAPPWGRSDRERRCMAMAAWRQVAGTSSAQVHSRSLPPLVPPINTAATASCCRTVVVAAVRGRGCARFRPWPPC